MRDARHHARHQRRPSTETRRRSQCLFPAPLPPFSPLPRSHARFRPEAKPLTSISLRNTMHQAITTMAVPMQCAWDLASKDLAGVFWRQHSQRAVRIDPFHPEGTEAVRESELVREGGRESAESGERETRNLACTHARACTTRPRRHRSLRACASSPSSPLDSMPTFARSLAATIARSLAATIAHTGRLVAGLARRKGACARAHLPTPPRRSSPRDPGEKKESRVTTWPREEGGGKAVRWPRGWQPRHCSLSAR